ncbi:MAG: hypothetical protein MAG795_00143 [Candidatus Woesearchaeota archaeon]|nr:hypothetical protein [Candidatus Woesearchaeota archaeon]
MRKILPIILSAGLLLSGCDQGYKTFDNPNLPTSNSKCIEMQDLETITLDVPVEASVVQYINNLPMYSPYSGFVSGIDTSVCGLDINLKIDPEFYTFSYGSIYEKDIEGKIGKHEVDLTSSPSVPNTNPNSTYVDSVKGSIGDMQVNLEYESGGFATISGGSFIVGEMKGTIGEYEISVKPKYVNLGLSGDSLTVALLQIELPNELFYLLKDS